MADELRGGQPSQPNPKIPSHRAADILRVWRRQGKSRCFKVLTADRGRKQSGPDHRDPNHHRVERKYQRDIDDHPDDHSQNVVCDTPDRNRRRAGVAAGF